MAHGRSAVADAVHWIALFVLLVSACGTVWGFGGMIPAARLVMMTGVICAAIFAILSRTMGTDRGLRLPVPAVLLLAYAGIGLLQLMPWHQPPATLMHHAVVPESAPLFSNSGTVGVPRSVSPARTRIEIATIVTVALAMLTGFDLVRTRQHLMAVLAVFAMNAAVLSVAGLIQFSRNLRFLFWGYPVSYTGLPFASFVNRNNAAAYFCVAVACALALCRLAFAGSLNERAHPGAQWNRGFGNWLAGMAESGRRVAARLNTVQLTALLLVAVNVAGVFFTTSRSGMLTIVIASMIVIPLATGLRRSLLAVPGVIFVAILAFWLLDVAGLNQKVATELETLSDPTRAIQSRINHWADSLAVVQDFPGSGIGLGGYRYGTLPYQRHFTRTWFQFADNQYVETVVEAGLPGLVIALLLLSSGWIVSLRLMRRHSNNSRRSSRDEANVLSRDHGHEGIGTPTLSAAGLAGLFITISMATHSMFDFGAVVPGAAVMIAIVFGALISVYLRRRDSSAVNHPDPLEALIVWKTSARASGITRIACIVMACLFVPEMWHASVADRAAADSNEFRRNADYTTSISEIEEMTRRVEAALKNRRDDERALREVSRLKSLEFRRRILDEYTLLAETPVDAAEAKRMWPATMPIVVRETMDVLARTGNAGMAERIADSAAMKTTFPQWVNSLAAVRRVVPLIPGVHRDIAIAKKAGGAGPDDLGNDLLRAEFAEPHDVEQLRDLGLLSAGRGRSELPIRFWRRSIEVSPRYELQILGEAQKRMPVSEIVDRLLPASFDRLIRLADTVEAGPLRREIVIRAESLRPKGDPDLLSNEDIVGVANLLRLSEQPNEAIDLLQARLDTNPEHIVMQTALAELHEAVGDLDAARRTWAYILYLDESNRHAAGRLKAVEQAIRAGESSD